MVATIIFLKFRRIISRGRDDFFDNGIYYAIIYMLKEICIEICDRIYKLLNILYSKIYDKPMIHIIGDSHSHVFRCNKFFIVHHVGAATAHNLMKEKSTTNSNRKLFNIIKKIGRKDIVILVFGEIDCRLHIYYQYKKNNEKIAMEKLISETINNYGTVMERLKLIGVNFLVLNIPPAGKQNNVFGFPYYAPPQIRSQIHKKFNKQLEAFCDKNDIRFINFYSKVVDDNGFILKKFTSDGIHFNHKIVDFVIASLNEKFKINM